MTYRLRIFGTAILSSSLLLACGDDGPSTEPDAAVDAPPSVVDPMALDQYDATEGEELAFGVEEGNIRNVHAR